ncbi:winged helix-turn-helix domain-containing protein [Halorubrum ezzemoulense]|uniref:winged helix-turn-helix domain-containing protein n=2 Tax=Halorubrum ezzemoulense TaxID=337243 RepID=UPI00232F79B1|nr:winged helix-turn-helix domain-containing protein [Halorubrum ezzemoulense]MDB2260540.1 winged helix-turn-helix domain-containing protein [Halorubrum ezzemoulense]MDB2267067.1 winged helix-turn-helix domain-containing protein [Halorubrum ezzemoulense]
MEKALWYLFVASRGGANRVRIVRRLRDRPRNANELAEALDVDYNTITHHLDMLKDHDVVEPSDHDYGKLYFLTDRFERHAETFEEIIGEVDAE